MENPQLTYASPSILTEDDSQLQTVIHEMVHQWIGNRITCQDWSDYWLNEGLTVFVQRKVLSKIEKKGDDLKNA